MSPTPEVSLTTLLRELVETPTVAETIEQVTEFAAQTFDTPFAGVTLIEGRGRHFRTAGPTHDVVRQADQLQDSLREGPCVDAATQSRTLVSNDLTSDQRWPNWAARIRHLGLHSILSSEIHAGGRRVGALNIYGGDPREFTREDMEVAQALATHAGIALRVAERIENLTIALDSRTVIGQAQGILMNRFGVDADRAFAILKRLSQDQNIRVVKIAQNVIDGILGGED